jgi:single-strand DNA-binding protein
MANFNAVMLMGRLTHDPELQYSKTGIPVCRLSLATNRKFKKSDGTDGEETLFIDVNTWRRLAEICAQFLKKGREVFISGTLVQSRWTDANGQKRSRIRVTADTVQFLGAPKNDGGGESAPDPDDAGEAAE